MFDWSGHMVLICRSAPFTTLSLTVPGPRRPFCRKSRKQQLPQGMSDGRPGRSDSPEDHRRQQPQHQQQVDSSKPASHSVAASECAATPDFRILREDVVHRRYLTLYNRVVRFPPQDDGQQGPVLEFDVAGHPQAEYHYAVVFPYHTANGMVTLIREYAQGLNSMVWCLPTGAFDPRRHSSYEACARAELSEEARLAGGTWVPLMPDGHPGIPEIKWCRNRFHAYLVLDPHHDAQPGQRDKEEYIQVCRVRVEELKPLMLGGGMLLPSITTCYMALDHIQHLQQHDHAQQRLPG